MLTRFKILFSIAVLLLAGSAFTSDAVGQGRAKSAAASEKRTATDAPSSSVIIIQGNDSTSGNGRAPQGTRAFINTKYIILASELATAAFAGPVYSVGWTWNNPAGAAAPVAMSAESHGNLKVYLLDTDPAVTSLADPTVDPSLAPYVKIIDTTLVMPATANQIDIDVRAGGPGTSLFTYVPGRAITLLFQYQSTDPVLPTPVGAPVVDCLNTPTNGIATYQSNTVNGTAGAFSAFRPTTRFGNAPTAAGVSVSGRVMNGERGLTNAVVSLSTPGGETISVATNRTGAFHFDDVEAGRTYTVSVSAKRFSFVPRTIEVNDNISDLNFTPDTGAAPFKR